MKDLYEALAEAHELDERKMETKHPQKRVHESQSGSNQVVTPNKVHEIIDSFKNPVNISGNKVNISNFII